MVLCKQIWAVLVVGLVLLGVVQITNAEVNFDGVDDFASTAGTTTVSGATSLTVACWMNIPATVGHTGQDVCLAHGDFNTAPNLAFMLRVNSPTTIRWAISDGTAFSNTTLTVGTIPASTWFHVACTWDGTTMACYINGVFAASTTSGVVTSINTAGKTLYIGTEGATSTTLAGSIGEVRYWTAKLSDNEIQSLGSGKVAGIGVRSGQGLWVMDECGLGSSGDGVVFVDRSGNGRDMTGNNGANNTGLVCGGSGLLSYAWGAY